MTDLEAVAVQICLDRIITVCSLYLPPSVVVEQRQFEHLCDQLPQPFLILGDFNAHHPLWGSATVDRRGKMLENVLLSRPLCLLNTGCPTYVNSATQSFSALDLSFCSPSLFQSITWVVVENPYGSDHFPVILRYSAATHSLTTRPRRWKLSDADWSLFEREAELSSSSFDHMDVDQANDLITETIINAATKSIPQTSGRLPKRPKPWWNSDCETTRKAQNRAWGIFRRYPTVVNLITFKKARAKARWTRQQAKRTSWKGFVSSLNNNTPSKTVWDRLRKIKGEYTSFSIPLLHSNGIPCRNLEEQANALGEHFQEVSSSSHYDRDFLKIKSSAEKRCISSGTADSYAYNRPFHMIELQTVLSSLKAAAPGPDRVAYSMLQHLSQTSREGLLHFFNLVWKEGRLPSCWKVATIIPLLKPGKDASSPTSYRPIALTSCLSKTFERLVNNRLVYYVEENKCLNKYQCGFRAGCSAVDHLIRLETTIREAFLRRQHCVCVFFDLEKAYDTAWRYGILRDVYSYGIRGRMLRCIADFLQGRSFRVQLGTTLSRPFIQENGVPQGSVLSVTLFIIKMNSVATAIPPSVSYSLYVDDIQICCSSSNMAMCERQLQLTINKLTKWSKENGFKFSPQKTVCVPFSRVRGMVPEPTLTLNNHDLAVQPEHKFLGLIFDRKLTFWSHIKYLKVKCSQSLNLLKVLSHRSWGADRETLHRIYVSVVRSRLDYGCIVYGSARLSVLRKLDPVHHAGLRLVLGAFRTSPVESLYVECNEWSLQRRRFYASALYALRLRGYPQHPALPSVQNTRFRQLFINKPSVVPPFSLRISQEMEHYHFTQYSLSVVEAGKCPPPWQVPLPYDDSLTKLNKRDTSAVVLQQEFETLKEGFGTHLELYTDGSKNDTGVACAMVTESVTQSYRLDKVASVFTAEVYGVILALNYILQHRVSSSVIYTDSLSCLRAVCSPLGTRNLLVRRARYFAGTALSKGYNVILCWVPSHVGIPGNEHADRAAAAAHSLDITSFPIPYQDLRPALKRVINTKWQSFWEPQCSNKLHLVKPKIGNSLPHLPSRLHEVLLSRLRIGHTFLTHGFLLRNEEPPQCPHCGVQLSILHVLITCPLYESHRQHHFLSLYKQLLPLHPAQLVGDEPFMPFEKVYDFLKDIGHLRNL